MVIIDEIIPITESLIPIDDKSFAKYASLIKIVIRYSNVHCIEYAILERLYSNESYIFLIY